MDDNLGTAPKMSRAVYEAVIDEAHRRGLRVAAHVFYLEDAKGVLAAGADLIAHSVRDRDVDEELIRLLKARDACVSPTLMREVSTFAYESEPAFFSDPFFLREADPAVLSALRDPKRQQEVRASRGAPGVPVPNEGWAHVPEGTPITYESNPPASGPHYPVWARWEEHLAVAHRNRAPESLCDQGTRP